MHLRLLSRISIEISLYKPNDMFNASMITMTIEKKNSYIEKSFDGSKLGSSKHKKFKKVTSTLSSSSSIPSVRRYYDHYRIEIHTKEMLQVVTKVKPKKKTKT